MLSVVPGDVDLDGLVSGADYTIWSDHFGLSAATHAQGDLNGDKFVTGADYTIWAENFGRQVESDLTLPSLADDGQADRLTLTRDGDRLMIERNGELLLRPTVGLVQTLTLTGTGDDDTLVVDLSAGDLGLSGGVQFVGGAGHDRLEFHSTGAHENLHVDAGTLRLGGLAIGFTEVEELDLHGGDGDDLLTVEGAPHVDLRFDGGAGFDALQLGAASFSHVAYLASGPNSGTIERDGRTIAYEGIEPIDDTTVAATLVINATAAAETIQIVDGPIVLGFQTTRVQSASASFELVNFANKTDVTVNGAGGGDTFDLSASLATPGLATLTLTGDAAADVFQIQRTRTGTTTTVDASGGDDQITVNGANLAGALDVIGGAQTANDTLTVLGTAGNDTFNLSGASLAVNGAAALTFSLIEVLNLDAAGGAGDVLDVQGTAGIDAFTLTSTQVTLAGQLPAGYANFETLNLLGLAGADTFNIQSTAAGVSSTAQGGADDDTFTVAGSALVGALSVDGGPQTTNDVLIVNGTAAADVLAVTATTVTVGASSPTTYSTIERVQLEALGGDDTINVSAPLTAALQVTGGGQTSADTLNITGAAAADAFELSGNVVIVNGAPVITFTQIEDLNLDGGGAADTLNVSGTAGADAFTLTRLRVTLGGSLPADYANFETINLEGLAGNDTFDIQSTAAGVASNVLGGADNDATTVAGDELDGALSVDGGTQTTSDTLTVNGTAAADTINVTATTVIVVGNATLTYAALEQVSVQALGGDDTINVAAPLTTALAVEGGANNDTLNVTGTAGNDTFDLNGNAVAVNGSPATTFAAVEDLNLNAAGGAADTLDVQGAAGVDAFTLTSVRVTRAGSLPADYSGFETLNLRGLGSGDTFDVQSTGAGVSSNALGGDGDDQFTVAGAALAGPLTINGGANNDTLVVNASTGNDLIQITNLAVQFSGQQAAGYSLVENVRVESFGGTDTVQVQSTAAGTSYQVNASTAVVEVQGGGLLGPLTVNGQSSSTLSVNGRPSVDALTVTGASISGFGAALNYSNVTSLTLDTQGDADGVTLNSTSAPTTIRTGDGDDTVLVNAIQHATTIDVGQRNDLLTVEATGLGAALTAIGGTQLSNDRLVVNGTNGNDDFTVTNTVLTLAGSSPLNYTAFELVEVIGLLGSDTFDVQSTLAGVTTTIVGNGGDDLVTVDAANANGPVFVSGLTNVNSLDVFGTGGADTFTLTATTVTLNAQPPITYDTTSQIVLHGLDGADVFNVNGTPDDSTVTLLGGAGLDEFNVRGTGTGSDTLVQGGGDNDTIRVSSLAPATSGGVLDGNLDAINGDLSIDAGAGANQLLISDRTAAVGNANALVTANQLTGLAGPGNASVIDFVATGGAYSLLQIAGSDVAADTFDLRGPLAASVELFTLGGADTVLVRSTAVGTSTVVNTGDGDDLVRVGSLPGPITVNNIQGALSVVGGAQAGQDRLVVDDSGETAATSATLSSTAVSGLSPQAINFSQVEAVDLLFGSADDNLLVDFASGALPNLTASMGEGTDRVVIQSPPVGVLVGPVIGIPPGNTQAVQLPSTVQIDGGGGAGDRVTLEGRDGVNDTLSVGVFGSLDSIQIQNVEYVRFFGRSGNDLMNNFTAASGFFEGGAGDDRLFGGSSTDVMFGGDGRDDLFGREGDDYLLPDHDSDRTVHVVGGETADGGIGFDHILAIGNALPDQVNSGEMISGFSFELDILTWLYGILTSTGSVLEQALAQEAVKP